MICFCSNRCSISVTRLMNWAKSKHNNPRKSDGRAPVIPLMTSLMKVTSLQNGGCSSVPPHCTDRGWPEETGWTHFWLVTATYTDSPPGSVATRTKIDVCSWQIAWMAIYMERCCLAMWGEESLSRTISSHSMVLSLHLAGRYYIQRKCPAFKWCCFVLYCITEFDSKIRAERKICLFELINSNLQRKQLLTHYVRHVWVII